MYPSNPDPAVFMMTRLSIPEVIENFPPWARSTFVVARSPLDCTNVVGCGFPAVTTCSQGFSAIFTSACDTCVLRRSKKVINSLANSSMHVADESRASEYTVFFIVSVARILLLSPSVKQLLKSPCNKISWLHSRKS